MGQVTYRRPVADFLAAAGAADWDWWTCDPRAQFAVLVHGWRESCAVEWARMLAAS